MNHEDIINNVIGREGGYTNNPDDRGSETIWGITVAVARAYGYAGDMREMPRATAFLIYQQRYWTEPKFNQVAQLNQTIAEELLDTGVNMGQATAVRFLQRALNVLNNRAKSWPDVVVDGVLGPLTLTCLKTYLDDRGEYGVTVLMRMLNAQQTVRYMEIAERDKAQEEFMYGWVKNRTA